MQRFFHSTVFARSLLWITVALLVAIIVSPVFAATASTTVDLTPFVEELRAYLSTLIIILVNVGLGYVIRYFSLSGSANALKIEELTRAFLHETADRGLTLALSRVQPHVQAVDVRSQIAVEAIDYVQRQAPAALKRLKVDPASLGRLIQAKLSEVLPTSDRPSSFGFPFGASGS